jgi:undecaprenyl-diphosphatase
VDFIISLDQDLLKLINQTWSNSYFDAFFPFITDLHKTWYFVLLMTLFIFFLPTQKIGKKGLWIGLCILISMALTDWTGSQFFKNPINRDRPFQISELSVVQRSPAQPGRSFISNHAANMAAFAAASSVLIPPSQIFVILVAILTAYSRVYTGVHFPTDVLAGALWGTLIGWSLATLFKRRLSIDWKRK